MYGFVNFALEELVLRNFGDEIWSKIKKEAGVEVDGHFMIRVIYNDDATYALVTAASKILNLPASAILQLFGQFFFEFCEESGFDKILTVLGGTTKDFLENLDALHDHLSTIYPGMKAPSFRCTENPDGSIILHYYSDRPGLEFIVIGLVKTVAKKLHNSDAEVNIIKSKGEDGCDHVQFQIIEKCQENQKKNIETSNMKMNLEKNFSNKQMMSPKTFCNAFPFHIIFDKHMQIKQCGTSISRVIPQMKSKTCKLTDIFTIIRPHITLDFQSICSQIMSVFVLGTKNGILEVKNLKKSSNTNENSVIDGSTRFKGQMVYLKDKELILFQCSPSIMSLDELYARGLTISDIPMHDTNRELMLMNEHWEEEWNLTQSLEILTDKLQKALLDLEIEKKKTDNLLYSVLPPSIAQQLRHGKPVLPARYEQATLMFCGVKDFTSFCAKYANDSQKIVNLLNSVFTKLDEKVNKYPEIYKVETVGDKYMAVCGLPEKVEFHTKYICRVALDMIDSCCEMEKIDGHEPVITVGINSGEIVTGVIGKRMPRFCLFGDTVNLTSRCETTGVKGQINVSEFAYNHLLKPENSDPSFHFEFRGEISMKGKPRPIKMWILSRKANNQEQSANKQLDFEQISKCPFSELAKNHQSSKN